MLTFDAQLWWCNEISQARELQSKAVPNVPTLQILDILGFVEFVGQNQSMFLNVKIYSDIYMNM